MLDMAEASPRTDKMPIETVLLQARDVGAAIVDEASERRRRPARPRAALPKRFGGDFAIGRTVPYVLKNAPCAVMVIRDPMAEESTP